MMNNGRHLPAGQGMMPDAGRRRQYNQHQHPHPHPHQQYPPQMYNPQYMQPYGASYYPQQLPPQYHNPPAQHQYSPYPPYVRSPPPMHHYTPNPMPQQHQPYPRPHPSPAVLPPYQAPPPTAPSSTQSTHTVPAPMTPPTPALAVSVLQPPPPPPPAPAVVSLPQEEAPLQIPFRVPLPWLSRPDLPFPARRRRKRKPTQQLSAELVELPMISQAANTNAEDEVRKEGEPEVKIKEDVSEHTIEGPIEGPADETADVMHQAAADSKIVRPDTPATSLPASDDNVSTNPTTPSSTQQHSQAPGDATPVAQKPAQRPTAPVIPALPALPRAVPRDAPKVAPEKIVTAPVEAAIPASSGNGELHIVVPTAEENNDEEAKETAPAAKAWTTPKLWTGLFNANPPTSSASSESGQGAAVAGGGKSNSESLAEALRSFNAVSTETKVAFLEPRGLVNTGNMCYMNSVLQVLIFCGPFYNFLDQVSKRAAHSFKSETPLLDAMILFMREYKIIDSAATVEKLRLRLKEGELEQYGEAFAPDFVYDVINHLPRFSSMRRGHQQDAEEFLGFLLEGLHDECVQVMRSIASATTSAIATPTNGPSSPISENSSIQGSVSGQENGWLEVGPKQKAAVTRSSGTITTGSPLTKIFGGNLRSELRVPGLKDSVTLEPYQPLQLDIGGPNVNNIVDALKGLTHCEALHGDFKSPKGPNVTATKQVFIEALPPVLILHLKRFQYDNAGGTQKIWKKVGYPLELEIPKEVFPRQKRSVYAHSGLPKYRLIAVVYHHGKNASGGHYTVDVRRQDGREWVRLDDTVIRRVRSEEVAEGGSEEDPKVIAAVLEAHKKDASISGNGFAAIENTEEDNDEDGWKKASGSGKKWSAVANGASTPKPKSEKFSIKDNKVAYLLFYQKI